MGRVLTSGANTLYLSTLSTLLSSIMSQIRLPSSSLAGRVYIPSSPPPQLDGAVEAFPTSLELEFHLMLEGTRNCGIFS
jgi:hypothetical protein